jgi:hypothetical protein
MNGVDPKVRTRPSREFLSRPRRTDPRPLVVLSLRSSDETSSTLSEYPALARLPKASCSVTDMPLLFFIRLGTQKTLRAARKEAAGEAPEVKKGRGGIKLE